MELLLVFRFIIYIIATIGCDYGNDRSICYFQRGCHNLRLQFTLEWSHGRVNVLLVRQCVTMNCDSKRYDEYLST